MSKSIIRLASRGSLEEELAALKAKLAALLSERDDLLLHVCKNIEMDFMLKIGRFEYEAFQAECDYLRAKRKCEMLQAFRNRQEVIAKAIERSQYETLTEE